MSNGRTWTPLDAAVEYTRRGWLVLPIPHRSKNPGFRGWQRLRLIETELHDHFNGRPQNIGVLLGEPSRWLVDVDLDHRRAVALADQFLPPTKAVFGRAGKRRSHWIYHTNSALPTEKHRSKAAGTIVEIRSTGAQTVFPPSIHESGEAIEWDDGLVEPARVAPKELQLAVRQLATQVLFDLGERMPPPKQRESAQSLTHQSRANSDSSDHPTRRCVAAMLRMHVEDQRDGSSRLYAAACRVVEFDLDDTQGLEAIRRYALERPFPSAWSDADILKRIRDAEKSCQRGVAIIAAGDRKECIVIDTDEHRVVTEAIAALNEDPDLFQRGGLLVRVRRDRTVPDGILRPKGAATISAVPPANLRERMTRFARFVRRKETADETIEVPAHPTNWLVGAAVARGEWLGIRHLLGVSDVPILRADGSICQTPGYDPETCVLFDPPSKFAFPAIPSEVDLQDAQTALAQLLEVVCDFRFEAAAHRAAWLAGLLTPLARFAFTGPAPLFLVDANVRGAGKGLLVQTIGRIVLGRELPVSSYARDTEEMRKKITAMAIAGDRMVLLDNLDGPFGNDALDRALTSTQWKDRILGKSEQVDLPLLPVWFATGNNVQVVADTMRRILHIRLDVLEEHPEDRRDFKHRNLMRWVGKNRGRLLTAALTILAAYIRSGRPKHHLIPFGSFEGWSSLVREAVVWLGLPDPCATRQSLAESSETSTDALAQLLEAWRAFDADYRGIFISEMMASLYPSDGQPPPRDNASIAMRTALENLIGCRPGKPPTTRQVANQLKPYRRRVVGGCYLDRDEQKSAKGKCWRLQSIAPVQPPRCDSADSGDSISAQPARIVQTNGKDWTERQQSHQSQQSH